MKNYRNLEGMTAAIAVLAEAERLGMYREAGSLPELSEMLTTGVRITAPGELERYVQDKEIPTPTGMRFVLYVVPEGSIPGSVAGWGCLILETTPEMQAEAPWFFAAFFCASAGQYAAMLEATRDAEDPK